MFCFPFLDKKIEGERGKEVRGRKLSVRRSRRKRRGRKGGEVRGGGGYGGGRNGTWKINEVFGIELDTRR